MRYRTAIPLAEGGTAEVFKAWDQQLGRHVALKFLRRDDPAMVERLLREARAQARLDHPNICHVYEVGERDGVPFIAMQLIEGETLDLAARHMSLREKIRALHDVAEAVHAAHRLELIHRDLKPGNVMVERTEDGRFVPYVLDFGLVRDLAAPGITHTGLVMGTPSFMAPEQARGLISALDRRTDVYGLGATLYAVLTGSPPFVGATAEVLLQVVERDPLPLRQHDPTLPRDLEDIVLKCLEKDPERRYASARELAQDLERWLDGQPVRARPQSLTYRLRRQMGRHRLLTGIAASAVVVVLTLGGWVTVERLRAERRAEVAQVLGQEVRDIEWQLRVAHMSPQHDVTADRELVRRRLAEIEARLRAEGAEGQAAVEYALGRGLLALDDTDAAAERLERAWSLGLRTPEVAFARGVALGRRYWRERQKARAERNPVERERRVTEAQATWRDPALAALQTLSAAESSAAAPLPYVEALMAFYEERWDDAKAKTEETLETAPWFWEAFQLRGDIHRLEAGALYESSQFDEGRRALVEAEAAYQAATAMAPSAPEPWMGRCSARIYLLFRSMVGSVAVEEFERSRLAALEACETLGRIRPDHPELPLNLANAQLMTARWVYARGGDPIADLELGLEHARRAVELQPESAAASRSLADLHLELGKVTTQRGGDATELLDEAARLFDQAYSLEPTTGAANGAGNAFFFKFQQDRRAGRDPRPAMDRAESYYRIAVDMSPDNVLLVGNIALVSRERALWDAAHGIDSRDRLDEVISLLEAQRERAPSYHFLPASAATTYLERARLEQRFGDDPWPWLERGRQAAAAAIELRGDTYEPWLPAMRLEVEAARLEVQAGQEPSALAAAERTISRYLELQNDQAEGYEERARLHAALARRQLALGRNPEGLLEAALADVATGFEVEASAARTLLPIEIELRLLASEAAAQGPAKRAAHAAAVAATQRWLALAPDDADAWAWAARVELAGVELAADPAEAESARQRGREALARALGINGNLRRELAEVVESARE